MMKQNEEKAQGVSCAHGVTPILAHLAPLERVTAFVPTVSSF